MIIAITGGTGTLGRPVAEELTARGHDVRVLSRHAPDHPVDLETGEGLADALAGVDVVVSAANGTKNAKGVLVDGTRRLLWATAAHHVCVSIVGIEQVPVPYYRVKVAQEQLVRESDRPWSIVRATQFHDLVDAVVSGAAKRHVRLRSSLRVQPVDVGEVARAVADVAEGPPLHDTIEVAGPEVLRLSELGDRGLPIPLPLPPRLLRPLRAGALTSAAPDVRGTITHKTWLTQR